MNSTINSTAGHVLADIPNTRIGRLIAAVSLKECVVIILFFLLWGYSMLLCYRYVKYNILVQACLPAPTVVADEAKLAIVFTYFFPFFLSFFFFSAFYFSPTLENLPCVKICFPQYFGITRRYMQKKNIFFR